MSVELSFCGRVYFGFLVDETFLVGYGLGAVEQTNRNLPYLGAG